MLLQEVHLFGPLPTQVLQEASQVIQLLIPLTNSLKVLEGHELTQSPALIEYPV